MMIKGSQEMCVIHEDGWISDAELHVEMLDSVDEREQIMAVRERLAREGTPLHLLESLYPLPPERDAEWTDGVRR